jgi:hypothetical protein
MFFIFESNLEFSAASKSASGAWPGVSEAAWFGVAEVLDAAVFFPAVGGVARS